MPKTKEKTVTVKLKDLDKVCRVCGKVSDSVRLRTYTTKNYQGGCGDSFCWASCDMSACKPLTVRACEGCEGAKRDLTH